MYQASRQFLTRLLYPLCTPAREKKNKGNGAFTVKCCDVMPANLRHPQAGPVRVSQFEFEFESALGKVRTDHRFASFSASVCLILTLWEFMGPCRPHGSSYTPFLDPIYCVEFSCFLTFGLHRFQGCCLVWRWASASFNSEALNRPSKVQNRGGSVIE